MLDKIFKLKASWQLSALLIVCDVILSTIIVYKVACKLINLL